MINYSGTVLANPKGGTITLDGKPLPTTGYFVDGIVSPLIYSPVSEPSDIDEFAEYLSEYSGADYLDWWVDQETDLLWINGLSWHESLTAALIVARDRDGAVISNIGG
jgi:hypothetical protein